VDVHVYVHFTDTAGLAVKLDELLALTRAQGVAVANELAALETQVAANTDAEQSAAILLGQLHALLVEAQNSGDPARVQAVIDSLGTSQAALAAAVKQNSIPS
jgi:2-hydroxychromene-2-carboxylate isomerase